MGFILYWSKNHNVKISDAEPAQFLDGSGSKKAPDMRTILGSGLVPIANIKVTSTSAPAPHPW